MLEAQGQGNLGLSMDHYFQSGEVGRYGTIVFMNHHFHRPIYLPG